MLNEKLKQITEKLSDYIYKFKPLETSQDVVHYTLDIEACAIKNKSEMLTYSIACMSCDNDSDICYWHNDVERFLNMVLYLDCKEVNFYAHNLLYDIKPFILKFVEMYGNNPVESNYFEKHQFNFYDKEKVKLKYLATNQRKKIGSFQYDLVMKDGILYKCTIKGENITINFFDTYKIVPFSLQKCCEDFLNLKLPKDGLDYDKERTLSDVLTKDEMSYIYNDVFGLAYLVKLLIIKGFDINGKHVQFTKLTNSGQSMYDYMETIFEDYKKKQNMFANPIVYDYVDSGLMKSKFHALDDEKNRNKKLNILFESLFPKQSYFTDAWQRHSYYGGLSTVHYENVEKYSKRKNRNGIVLDVNSLYPFIMNGNKDEKFLLPFGSNEFKRKPYKKMSERYKKQYPLYIQEIIIYDFEVKKGKMAFVQVKDNPNFNGREIIKNNVKDGKKVPIKLRLCNPLFELLFECYNMKSYELGSHMAFQGAYDLFKNYIDYWGTVKKNESGAKRATAKLRQNGLYGKFGMAGLNEITEFENEDGKFTIKHTHDNYVSDTVYLPMASFITSYAKRYLVTAINNNYSRFLYCDTDSLHLYGTLEQVKGVKIGSKEYGYWDNEMCFDDFKYIGAKRYAERAIIKSCKVKKTGEIIKLDNFYLARWEIKCCGLTDTIMKKVKDIKVFDNCKHTQKELDKMKIYTKENDVYYYYDEQCTKKIVGLIKSKKSKIIKGGTIIMEQPYKISNNYYVL